MINELRGACSRKLAHAPTANRKFAADHYNLGMTLKATGVSEGCEMPATSTKIAAKSVDRYYKIAECRQFGVTPSQFAQRPYPLQTPCRLRGHNPLL